MNKQEFLENLRGRLSALPQDEIKERLNFYSEMIDDRMEEGKSEEQAILEIGSADEIAAQTVAETSPAPAKPLRKRGALEITLLVLGSPIWLSLLIAAVAVFISIYAVLWSVIIALWAVFTALLGSALGLLAAGGGHAFGGDYSGGAVMISAAFVCAGLGIFMFFACKAATKGVLLLTKKFGLWTKSRFLRKGQVK